MIAAVVVICLIGFLMMWCLVAASSDCPHYIEGRVVLERDLDLLTFKTSEKDEESEVILYE